MLPPSGVSGPRASVRLVAGMSVRRPLWLFARPVVHRVAVVYALCLCIALRAGRPSPLGAA
eukprot:5307443-Amphidinium_carterae.1